MKAALVFIAFILSTLRCGVPFIIHTCNWRRNESNTSNFNFELHAFDSKDKLAKRVDEAQEIVVVFSFDLVHFLLPIKNKNKKNQHNFWSDYEFVAYFILIGQQWVNKY